ncbi:hypothetical protein ACQEUX_12145 [Micromonospora sp. CA-259024]|uniref:hypothetical protein n=1 Tax=Micromonospora sp. CA-259024 TaxID=3239965 RepID=UPI003D93415E
MSGTYAQVVPIKRLVMGTNVPGRDIPPSGRLRSNTLLDKSHPFPPPEHEPHTTCGVEISTHVT